MQRKCPEALRVHRTCMTLRCFSQDDTKISFSPPELVPQHTSYSGFPDFFVVVTYEKKCFVTGNSTQLTSQPVSLYLANKQCEMPQTGITNSIGDANTNCAAAHVDRQYNNTPRQLFIYYHLQKIDEDHCRLPS